MFFQGLLVACGSSKGTIYLAELSQNLGTADKNDKQLLTHVRIYQVFSIQFSLSIIEIHFHFVSSDFRTREQT